MVKILLALLAVVALSASAVAQEPAGPGAFGGGFTRDGKGKAAQKTGLTIQAFDNEDDDSGSALYTEHTPGSGKPLSVVIELDCVVTDENTAYASGTASSSSDDYDEETVAVQIVDNGEGRGRDEFGIQVLTQVEAILGALLGDCGAGSISTNHVKGGNFQVFAAE